MALYGNSHLTGNERFFDDNEIIVTKTDLSGKLTYANRTFLNTAGYSESECMGKPHNLIRHPDMPRSVFSMLWDTIEDGKEIFAYVINRSKNGDHYWVLAHVTPSIDQGGNIVGYHSNRRVPNRLVVEQSIVPFYKDLISIEKAASSHKEGMAKAVAKVKEVVSQKHTEFNEFILSLGS